jgi:hypothetical protein
VTKFNGAANCKNLSVSAGCVNSVDCEESDIGDKGAGERDRDGEMCVDGNDWHGNCDGDCSPVSRTVYWNESRRSCSSSSMNKGAGGGHRDGEGDGGGDGDCFPGSRTVFWNESSRSCSYSSMNKGEGGRHRDGEGDGDGDGDGGGDCSPVSRTLFWNESSRSCSSSSMIMGAGGRHRDGEGDGGDGDGDRDGDISRFCCSRVGIDSSKVSKSNALGASDSCSWFVFKYFSIVDNDKQIVVPIQI